MNRHEEEARAAGVCFYTVPSELTDEQIDPLLRSVVRKINRSGWVLTGESCQGHPDASSPGPWTSNTRPMLRLVCRYSRAGEMLRILNEAMIVLGDERVPAGVLGYELWPQARAKRPWFEVLVYVNATIAYQRDAGVAAFGRFAEMIGELQPTTLEQRALEDDLVYVGVSRELVEKAQSFRAWPVHYRFETIDNDPFRVQMVLAEADPHLMLAELRARLLA